MWSWEFLADYRADDAENVESGLQEVTGSLARCVVRVLLLHHFVATAA